MIEIWILFSYSALQWDYAVTDSPSVKMLTFLLYVKSQIITCFIDLPTVSKMDKKICVLMFCKLLGAMNTPYQCFSSLHHLFTFRTMTLNSLSFFSLIWFYIVILHLHTTSLAKGKKPYIQEIYSIIAVNGN